MQAHNPVPNVELEVIQQADEWARAKAGKWLADYHG